MNSFEMPFLFIFTDEELAEMWMHYLKIAAIVRDAENRHQIVITDNEIHAGVHFRAKNILAEAKRREQTRRQILRLT